MTITYGMSKNVIFEVGDTVKFRRTPPDQEYIITKFLSKSYVTLRGVENEKHHAACALSALIKVMKEMEPEREVEEEKELTKSTSCLRCGRSLTAERSVACGYGPTCWRILFGGTQPKLPRSRRRLSRRKEIDTTGLEDIREWFR